MPRRVLHPNNLIALPIAANLHADWLGNANTPADIAEILQRSTGGTRVSIASQDERKALLADAKRMRKERKEEGITVNGPHGPYQNYNTKAWDTFLATFAEKASHQAVAAAIKARKEAEQARAEKAKARKAAAAETAERMARNAEEDRLGHENYVKLLAEGGKRGVQIAD